jgi:NitT/TauT family transport system substrate-binding protein
MTVTRTILHLLALGAFGFAAVPAQAAEALKVAYSDWPGWVAWEVAIQKGWFKDAGVAVDFVWFEYGPSMDAFSAGKVDAVCVTNGDALVTGSAGKASTCIVINDYSNGNDMIIAAPGTADIKSLKGKKIGVELNLVDHLLLLKALEASGLAEGDVTLVNMPTSETPQGLASGGVAAIAAWQPNAGQALRQVAGSKVLFSSKNAPGLIYDGLYVARESLAARKAEWAKVAAVWPKVVAFIADPATQPEALKLMSARVMLTAEQYKPLLDGTHLLDLAANHTAYAVGAGLDSIYGSSTIVNAFNVAHGVYKEPQDVKAYLDPSITAALK